MRNRFAETLAGVAREDSRVYIVVADISPKQLAWDADCDLRTFTIKDEFIHCYGSHADLLSAHGISTERVLRDLV